MSLHGLQVGIFLASGLLLVLLGVMIVKEDPGRRLNRTTAAMLIFGGLGSLMGALGASLVTPEAAAAAGAAAEAATQTVISLHNIREFTVLWEFFFPTLVLFSLIFPRETDPIQRHPRLWVVLYLPYVLHLLLVVLVLVFPEVLEIRDLGGGGGVLGPFIAVLRFAVVLTSTLFKVMYDAHIELWSAVNVLYVVAALLLLRRTRRGLENRKLQMQVAILQLGIGGSVGIYIAVQVLPVFLPFLRAPAWFSALMLPVALVIGCGAVAWVIIRHQFLDVQVLAKRGLIYSAATGVVVGFFFLLFNWFSGLYRSLAGGTESSNSFVMIIFLVVAVLAFQPLLGRIESLVDRFFIRDETDYRNVLRQSVSNIIGILDMDSLMRATYQTLERAFLVDEAAIILLDRKTGAYRFIRRGPPPLKQKEWTLKPPKALEADDLGVLERPEDALLDLRRRAPTGPGRAIFRRGDPVTEMLARATGPVRFELLKEALEEEGSSETPLQGLNPRLVIPLKQRHELVGIITLGRKLADTGFNSEEMTLIAVLASQVAVAVENAWLHEERLEQERIREELAVAREIQQTLLPDRFPRGPTFEISAINLPSREIGGDYFDFLVTPPGEVTEIGKVLMVVGDVSGKGTPAALLMASLQATLRAVYESLPGLAATAGKVNTVMCRSTAAEKFVTLFLAEYDTTTRTLTYVNAGHNFPVLTRATGEQLLLEKGGLLVGVIESAEYDEGHVQFEPGDVLTIYTDGVTEAMNRADEEFGEERLMSILRDRSYLAAREIRDEIYREVLSFAGDRSQSDDLTLVILKGL